MHIRMESRAADLKDRNKYGLDALGCR